MNLDKDEAIRLINYAAEQAHSRYITHGFGMLYMYQEKAEEAADFVAANYPKKISGFPFIKAEKDATGKPAKEIADNIISQKAKWIAAAAKIEKIRLGAISKIRTGIKSNFKETSKAISSLEKI